MSHYAREALQLLQTNRNADSEAGPSSSASRPYSYEEVNLALVQATSEDHPRAGLVRALLAMGADINFSRRKSANVFKKMIGKGQKPRRNPLLARAVARCPPDIITLLATHADQTTLDAALPAANARGDLDVLQVLLDAGADPGGVAPAFRQSFDGGTYAAPHMDVRIPPPRPADESWHQEQLDRVLARRDRYRSAENLGAAARADQERLRFKIAEMQVERSRSRGGSASRRPSLPGSSTGKTVGGTASGDFFGSVGRGTEPDE